MPDGNAKRERKMAVDTRGLFATHVDSVVGEGGDRNFKSLLFSLPRPQHGRGPLVATIEISLAPALLTACTLATPLTFWPCSHRKMHDCLSQVTFSAVAAVSLAAAVASPAASMDLEALVGAGSGEVSVGAGRRSRRTHTRRDPRLESSPKRSSPEKALRTSGW